MVDKTMKTNGIIVGFFGFLGLILPSTPIYSIFLSNIPSLLIYSVSTIAVFGGVALVIKGSRK